MDDACRAIVVEIARRLAVEIEFDARPEWEARQRGLDAQLTDFGWICGAHYVMRADRGAGVTLLAAPVPAGARYAGRPVYYSDIIVRSNSTHRCFEDLAGATWAYNEPTSQSGFHVVRYGLARRALNFDFFGGVVETGAHETTVELIRRGEADGAGIDSTVLEWLRRRDPALGSDVRVLERLGPSPMPPWVAGARTSPRCVQRCARCC